MANSVKDDTYPVYLLDGNVLVALTCESHVHHIDAKRWFVDYSLPFSTCPITQGTLLRLLINLEKLSVQDSLAIVKELIEHPRHHFWPDILSYLDVNWNGVIGHRQVTDAYLTALTRHHHGKFITFDKGLVSLHADIAISPNDFGQHE